MQAPTNVVTLSTMRGMILALALLGCSAAPTVSDTYDTETDYATHALTDGGTDAGDAAPSSGYDPTRDLCGEHCPGGTRCVLVEVGGFCAHRCWPTGETVSCTWGPDVR